MKKIDSERMIPQLPCACASLRRVTRSVTKMYNQELSLTGLELTQFTLLMALKMTGETTQGRLGKVLVLDSTSLTRMLRPLLKHGWVLEREGVDRRQRLLRLSVSGASKLEKSSPYWERAQARLERKLGQTRWEQMGGFLMEILAASNAG